MATVVVGDDVSGIALESPHKSIAVAQDFPCTIEGIGELRTSWIGRKGVQEIQQSKLQEEAQTAVQAKAAEVRAIAAECLKAFKEAGIEHSDLHKCRRL